MHEASFPLDAWLYQTRTFLTPRSLGRRAWRLTAGSMQQRLIHIVNTVSKEGGTITQPSMQRPFSQLVCPGLGVAVKTDHLRQQAWSTSARAQGQDHMPENTPFQRDLQERMSSVTPPPLRIIRPAVAVDSRPTTSFSLLPTTTYSLLSVISSELHIPWCADSLSRLHVHSDILPTPATARRIMLSSPPILRTDYTSSLRTE